jgi:serine/threonine protein kinase/tetratricopeptide (TPR) repeat protein
VSVPLAPDRWRRVIDLFHDAAAVPRDSRAAWLEAACGGDDELRREVESLLATDEAPPDRASFAQVIESAIADAANAAPGLGPAQRIGPYRLLQEIGAGGMGTVFLAERDDDEFHQRVALKVARGALGAEALRRFRAERQILASLEHALIARLLDGGTTADGVPYIVMEFVDGAPIDEHMRARQLTVRERVELFCRVCDAVTHAHRSLVVHRDLKPSNILVTADGTPKLLDFGIAKLLDESAEPDAPVTVTGLRALTPEYASPEQIRGEPITTSTDVYSLGVILFELLTGQRPFAFDTHRVAEIERVVCHVEPRKPSVMVIGRDARQLAGDLDTIVLTALRKEPARRYESAARLAEDLRRHLGGLPILMRPATWRYRSSRFVQRHRVGAGVAAVVALLVLAFAAALGVQMRRVARERDTAQQVSNLLLEMYAAFNPSESRGSQVTADAVLDRGAARIQAELQDQPDVQARMLDAIGTLYLEIGLTDRAIDVLQSSLSIRQTAGQRDTLEAAKTLNQLANAHRGHAAYAAAEPLAREALEIRRRRSGGRSPDTAESLDTLGVLLLLQGYPVEGAPLLTEALDIWRQTNGSASAEFAATLLNLPRFWRERADYLQAEGIPRGDLLKAEKFERERLAIRRKAFGDVHVFTTNSLSAVGLLLRADRRPQEAEPLLREALALRRQLFGERHPSVVEAMSSLALVLQDVGKRPEAEEWYRRANETMRAEGSRDPQYATNLANLGTLLAETSRFDEAADAFREAIDARRRMLGRDHPSVARTEDTLARLLCDQGRFHDALPVAEEALAIRRAKLGDRHYETASSMVTHARVLAALGRYAEAAPLLRSGHAIRAAALPPDDARLSEDVRLLAVLR